MKIRVGDFVRVMVGKDKGKESIVDRVYPKQNKVLLQGLNQYKKHMKKSDQFPQGGVVEVPRPLDVSNVMLVTADGKSVSRVGYVVEGEKKIRIEKRSGERIKEKEKAK
jgi:large subunit ribosomal protein L24